MKKIILAITTLFILNSVFCQYTVTKVVGVIKNKTTGEAIRIGSKLNDADVLTFATPNALLRAIIAGKGTVVISPSPTAIKTNNVLIQELKSCFRVDAKQGSLSGRSVSIEQLPESITASAAVNNRIRIAYLNKYLFSSATYSVANGSQFILQIEAPNNSPIIHQLRTAKDTLLLYANDFQIDNLGSKEPTYTLGFYNKATNKTEAIAQLKPYFDEAGEMESIIAAVSNSPSSNTKTQLMEQCFSQVYAALGKPSDIDFITSFNQIAANIPDKVYPKAGMGSKEDVEAYKKAATISATLMRDEIDLPTKFSLRAYTPPVKSQGTFGTCAAWSSAYAARTIAWSVRNGYNNIDNSKEIIANSFSPEFVYLSVKDADDAKCSNGLYIGKALDFMKGDGNLVWNKTKYNCDTTYDISTASKLALPFKIKDYQRVCNWGDINDKTITDIKIALSQKKPLVFGMHLPLSFDKIDKKTGIFYASDADREEGKKVRARTFAYRGHAMCIMGYNDEINGGSFEIMNSWGTWNGKDGFYWVSYEDMKAFAADVYIINDFEKTVVNNKLMLEGSLLFLKGEKNNNDKYEFVNEMQVEKKMVSSRGIDVENDEEAKPAYANFKFIQPYKSGTKFKIKFTAKTPCYVYVFGKDNSDVYALFPNAKSNESALIDFKGSSIMLPTPDKSFTLNTITGREKTCVLVSKSPINVSQLIANLKTGSDNIYDEVRKFLGTRLLEMKAENFINKTMQFSVETTQQQVMGFFIEMEHI